MKLTCVGIWQGSSTEIWTHQSLIRTMRLRWLHRDLQETVTRGCTLWVFLPGFTNTHASQPTHTYTLARRQAVFFGRIIACHPWLSSYVTVSLALVLAPSYLVASGKVRVAVSALSHWVQAGQTQQALPCLSLCRPDHLIHGGFTHTPQRGAVTTCQL